MTLFLFLGVVVGRLAGVYANGDMTEGLASSVFQEQPERTTVYESYTATFRCSVVNSSFSIFWLVNNSDAAFTVNRERGFSIVEDSKTHTISRLEVAGLVFNNNTEIHCAAFQEHDDPLLTWIESDKALLVVEGKTGASSDYLSLKPTPLSTTPPPDRPSTDAWKFLEKKTTFLPVAIAVVLILLVMIVIPVLVIVFIIRRKRKKSHQLAQQNMSNTANYELNKWQEKVPPSDQDMTSNTEV